MCTLMAGSGCWVGGCILKSIVERNLTRHVPEKWKLQHKQAPENDPFSYAFGPENDDGLPKANEINRRNLHEMKGPVTHLGCLQVIGV